MLHHKEEGFERSRSKGHRRPVAPPQESFTGVELEIAEFVQASAGRMHRRFRRIQKNSAAT